MQSSDEELQPACCHNDKIGKLDRGVLQAYLQLVPARVPVRSSPDDWPGS